MSTFQQAAEALQQAITDQSTAADRILRKVEQQAIDLAAARQQYNKRSRMHVIIATVVLFALWLSLTVATVHAMGSSPVVAMLMAGWMCFGATAALAAAHRV